MTKETTQTVSRPLSPHLQVYRWQVTMLVSILHRATGVALAAGSFLLVGWLWAAAYDAACFAVMHKFFDGIVGKLLLFGWSLAFYFHFCNGIRHLFWDAGMGFDPVKAERSAFAVILFSAVLTLFTWLLLITDGVK